VKILVRIFGGLKIDLENGKRNFTDTDNTAKQMIDRIAKSYAEYTEEGLYGCSEPYDEDINEIDDAKYMEIGNGKVLIFKGSKANGTIPKKYKDKVSDGILTDDIIADNLIQTKEILGINGNIKY